MRALEQALKQAGNRDFTITVLPQANHLFLQAKSGTSTEYASLSRFVPGYFDVMAAWLAPRVAATAP